MYLFSLKTFFGFAKTKVYLIQSYFHAQLFHLLKLSVQIHANFFWFFSISSWPIYERFLNFAFVPSKNSRQLSPSPSCRNVTISSCGSAPWPNPFSVGLLSISTCPRNWWATCSQRTVTTSWFLTDGSKIICDTYKKYWVKEITNYLYKFVFQ